MEDWVGEPSGVKEEVLGQIEDGMSVREVGREDE